jgi:putative phosphoribosyl transferase
MGVTEAERVVRICLPEVILEGNLAVKEGQPVVIFAHGSASSRHSPRNRFIARALNEAGIGTLLFDLLTREEDMEYERRFDIGLLSVRLEKVTRSLKQQPEALTKIGYFGESTGAAAALKAAADLARDVGAVVSCGGRPDLAGNALGRIEAPTLLAVGGLDDTVIELNREAYRMMRGIKELKIVPDASHLLEEPGTIKEVALLAVTWFKKYLASPSSTIATFSRSDKKKSRFARIFT